MPVALAFGLIGALSTSIIAMCVAALSTWLGSWVDSLVQRITEIDIVIPSLPMAIMVYMVYSKSIWTILGVIVLLNIFGSTIKNYQAAFLQIKEMPYIEAAQVYGAGNGRIILNYLVPRLLPMLIPQLVILIPGYVFFEATLAYLNVYDPYLPTWGKVIYDVMKMVPTKNIIIGLLNPLG
jgi:peptide/nickel transport system permease protein